MATTISGSSGVTYPAGGTDNPAGTGVGTTDTQTLTNKTLGSGLVAGASLITTGTSQASTSGTSIDFTSIPSWVKRITVMFRGVSTSGTSDFLMQIGSGSITSTGYTSAGIAVQGGAGSGTATTTTTGFNLTVTSNSDATQAFTGCIYLNAYGGNIWIQNGALVMVTNGARVPITSGSLALSGALDRVRITTVNGTDTFDAGSINILYE